MICKNCGHKIVKNNGEFESGKWKHKDEIIKMLKAFPNASECGVMLSEDEDCHCNEPEKEAKTK